MIQELHTVYRHTCDMCHGSVECNRPSTGGEAAPLLTLSSIIRGGQPVFHSREICADCCERPLIEVLRALAPQGDGGMLGNEKHRLLTFTPEQYVSVKEGGDA